MNKHYDTPRIGNPFAFKRTAPKPRKLASVPAPVQGDQAPTAGVTMTRGLFDVIALFGWVYLAVITVTTLVGALVPVFQGVLWIAGVVLLVGTVLAIPGIFMIALAQTSRSIVDTAENTRRLVDLLESRLNSQTNV